MSAVRYTSLKHRIEERINLIRALQTSQDWHATQESRPPPAQSLPMRPPSRALGTLNQGRAQFSVALMSRAANTSSGKAKRYASVGPDSGSPGLGPLRERQHKTVPPVPANEPGESQIMPDKARLRQFVEVHLEENRNDIRSIKKRAHRHAQKYAGSNDDNALNAWRGLQQQLSLLIRLERDMKGILLEL